MLGAGPVALAATPGSRSRPAVAFDGANYLAAWQDDLDLDSVRVSPAGAVLGPVAAISAAAQAQLGPVIAHGTSGSLVVWEEDEETSAEAKATEAVTVGKRIRVEIEEDKKAVGLIGHAMHVVRLVIRNESVLH